MATYIIADLHLSENKPLLLNALANFYDKTLILNDRLIILGDMFDVFVGLDPKSAFHQKIRAIISKENSYDLHLYASRRLLPPYGGGAF